MNGKKLIAVSWWTFAYVILAWALFSFSALGDCLQGPEGAACRAQGGTFTDTLLLVEVFVYAALTWVLFFRRR
jgi:hypothetical protein